MYSLQQALTVRLANQPVRYKPIPELQGARALVVDDDIDTCRSVCKMLRSIDMQPDWTVIRQQEKSVHCPITEKRIFRSLP